jgi:hypothetical protein
MATSKKRKKLLPKGMELNFPQNVNELREIGDKQRHCVGSLFYAERCVDGANVIFQIAPRNNMKHGFTFQFARSGALLQSKGFLNEAVNNTMKQVAKQVFKALMQGEDTFLSYAA